MKLSFDWLGDFVDLSGLTAQEVADKLTMGAFEVEEVRIHGADIVGPLVIGQIVDIQPHPNADKIRVTKIRLEEGAEAREIVCGAWNIEVGHKIPVALPGAKVLNRHDGSALHIKENKIRGVTSNGMLCSPSELGLSADGEGILLLDPSTPIGIDAKEFLGIKTDQILIVEPRSNRGDALSVLGLAREVAALFGRPLKELAWVDEFEQMEANAAKDLPLVKTSIENPEDCPFFSIRTLSQLSGGESDGVLRRRLEAIGVKPVSKIVDITNYVMHELGQPLHAYDMGRLADGQLNVRRATENEVLRTIDDKERKLDPDVLVIANSKNVVGMAGVMGGKESEIADKTSVVALEAASFNSARVRRSSRKVGLSSDSSLRFERGVDTASVRNASNRAAYLMVKHCGAKLGQLACAGSDQIERPKVKVRMSELRRICEINLSADAAGEMLEPLGFKPILSADDYNAGILTVQVPSFRMKDVSREIDLIEELCRLYGYEKLPISMPQNTIPAQPVDPLPSQVRTCLAGLGLSEAWLSSLTSLSDLNCLQQNHKNNGKHDTAIGVLNPLSAEHQVLRQSLIPGLIRAASYNQDRGNPSPWLFELGRVYFHANKVRSIAMQQANMAQHKRTNAFEESNVAAIIVGEPTLSTWLETKPSSSDDLHTPDIRPFFLIKGLFETLAASLRISPSNLSFESDWQEKSETHAWLHPGRSARIVFQAADASDKQDASKKKGGRKAVPQVIGYIGELHPALADEFKLTGRTAVMELSLPSLKESIKTVGFEEIFVTPSMQRDLTVDVEREVKNQDIEDVIRSSSDETLRNVELVSVFPLSDKTKSLSYRLSFQHASQTLTAQAVDAVMAKLRDELASKVKAAFRL